VTRGSEQRSIAARRVNGYNAEADKERIARQGGEGDGGRKEWKVIDSGGKTLVGKAAGSKSGSSIKRTGKNASVKKKAPKRDRKHITMPEGYEKKGLQRLKTSVLSRERTGTGCGARSRSERVL